MRFVIPPPSPQELGSASHINIPTPASDDAAPRTAAVVAVVAAEPAGVLAGRGGEGIGDARAGGVGRLVAIRNGRCRLRQTPNGDGRPYLSLT